MLIDAVTCRRVDVLPDRKAATLADWLREHPGVEIVCRDGSAAYAEAIRQGAPAAAQVSDRGAPLPGSPPRAQHPGRHDGDPGSDGANPRAVADDPTPERIRTRLEWLMADNAT